MSLGLFLNKNGSSVQTWLSILSCPVETTLLCFLWGSPATRKWSQPPAPCDRPNSAAALTKLLSEQCVLCVSSSAVSDSATPRTAVCQAPLSMEFSRHGDQTVFGSAPSTHFRVSTPLSQAWAMLWEGAGSRWALPPWEPPLPPTQSQSTPSPPTTSVAEPEASTSLVARDGWAATRLGTHTAFRRHWQGLVRADGKVRGHSIPQIPFLRALPCPSLHKLESFQTELKPSSSPPT